MPQVLICHSIQCKAESAMIAESEVCECTSAAEPTHASPVRASRFREAEKPTDSIVSNIVLLESNSVFTHGF